MMEKIESENVYDSTDDHSSSATSSDNQYENDEIAGPDTNKDIHKGMSMEELLALQEKVGTKIFSQKIKESEMKQNSVNKKVANCTRANKNRPQEVPMIRKPAPRMNLLTPKQMKRKDIARDPRFDDLSGKLDIVAWKNNYKFISDKRKKEKRILQKELKRTKHTEHMNRIKKVIQRMENQERESEKLSRERMIKKHFREEAISSMQAGKTPKFVSKKEKVLTLKAAHYDKIKKGNKMDKYLARKEKKARLKELKTL